jgi:hypothetical protein
MALHATTASRSATRPKVTGATCQLPAVGERWDDRGINRQVRPGDSTLGKHSPDRSALNPPDPSGVPDDMGRVSTADAETR